MFWVPPGLCLFKAFSCGARGGGGWVALLQEGQVLHYTQRK